jgi:hypothetical protein
MAEMLFCQAFLSDFLKWYIRLKKSLETIFTNKKTKLP